MLQMFADILKNEVAIMEDVVEAIEMLSQRNIVDYLLIIIPIIISLIAIFISITIAKKQNNVAMFKLRYKAFATIKRVLNFNIVFYVTDHPRIIVECFNGSFESCIDVQDKVKSRLMIMTKLDEMQENIIAISDILDNSDKKILEKTFSELSKIINNAIDQTTDSQSIKKFKTLCLCLEKITMEKLTRKIFGAECCFNYVIPEMSKEPNKIDYVDISAAEKIISDIVKNEEKQKRE